MSPKPSPYQQAIFDFIAPSKGPHGVGSAYAGSGKTWLLEQCADRIDEDETLFFGAFNTSIAKELSNRIQRENATVKTLHGLGLDALKRGWGKRVEVKDHVDYLADVINRTLPRGASEDAKSDVRTLVEKCMVFVADDCLREGCSIGGDDTPEAVAWNRVYDLMERFECYPNDPHVVEPEQYVTWALKALERLREPSDVICFGQMLYVPAFHRWKTGHFRRVFIDETQDMNRGQLILAQQALHELGRFFAVGDRKQAIYVWNGADSGSIDKIKKVFKAEEFKLPISYRAPEAVAELVRGYIPDFQARPGAPQGLVKEVDEAFMRANWQRGDMLISRKNAPLPRFCLAALASGVPAFIKGGKDVTRGLFELIRKSRKSDVPDFIRWLRDYEERRVAALVAAKQVKKADELADTVATLVELSDDCDTTDELKTRLTSLFADDGPDGKLMCGTTHKVKGLETAPGKAVWLDWSSFRESSEEERNITYVAQTRTQDKLYLVRAGDSKAKKRVSPRETKEATDAR